MIEDKLVQQVIEDLYLDGLYKFDISEKVENLETTFYIYCLGCKSDIIDLGRQTELTLQEFSDSLINMQNEYYYLALKGL